MTGWTTPCSKVQVNFGDGTGDQQYTIASPYQLPLQVTHTYAAAGLYNVVAMGQTGASGPCVGTVSTPVEVTSGNVVTNGDFSQGLGPNGLPVGWGIFSQGGPANWTLDNGIKFYRTGATWQAVVLQYTGLALATGAPLEATFTMGNTDAVRKRLLMLIHTDISDDLAACSFWVDANQTPQAYTMRMHTTKNWTNASISFYAADATAPGTTGAYHLNHVTLTYRPALNSAKTECVDPLVPTEGDGWSFTNLILDPDFIWGGSGWWTYQGQQGQEWQWVNELPDQQRVEVRRHSGSPPPVVRQSQPEWSGVVPARQRVQLTFELRNLRTTRQRVNVTLQDASAPGGGTLAFCTFWLPANMPGKALYAMTAYAATEWTAPELVVSPQTVGEQGDNGWIQFDTVTLRKTNRPMPGTECWEPGAFTVDSTGFINAEWPGGPAPEPVPEAEIGYGGYGGYAERTDAGQRFSVEAGSLDPAAPLDGLTFHPESFSHPSGPSTPEPSTRTDPLTVVIGGTSSGLVTSSPAGITCAGSTVSCTGWFGEGTPVTLTATPDPGMVFVGWVGCVPTPANPLTCPITVNGPQSVRAVFGSPLQYYHLDVLGSVRMISNAAGAVVRRHDYFAFGEDIEGPTGDPRRFTGKERDAETELHYFGARYYRNVWGRFTSVDPYNIFNEADSQEELLAFLANPQNWNRYTYVLNRPQNLTDPDGRYPQLLPILQKIGPTVLNFLRQSYYAVIRAIGSPAGREIAQNIAEVAAGYDGPSASPLGATARGISRGASEIIEGLAAHSALGNSTLAGKFGLSDVIEAGLAMVGRGAKEIFDRNTGQFTGWRSADGRVVFRIAQEKRGGGVFANIDFYRMIKGDLMLVQNVHIEVK